MNRFALQYKDAFCCQLVSCSIEKQLHHHDELSACYYTEDLRGRMPLQLIEFLGAHADAFMKGSLQFEGPLTAGSDGYGAGFGIIAEPSAREVDLTGGLTPLMWLLPQASLCHTAQRHM